MSKKIYPPGIIEDKLGSGLVSRLVGYQLKDIVEKQGDINLNLVSA